jgi:hypothetical protein
MSFFVVVDDDDDDVVVVVVLLSTVDLFYPPQPHKVCQPVKIKFRGYL